MADLPLLLPPFDSPRSLLFSSLASLLHALLPLALLWWDLMLSATSSKYHSCRRMIRPHRSPRCFAAPASSSPSLPGDGYGVARLDGEEAQGREPQPQDSSKLELADDGGASVSETSPSSSTKRKRIDEEEVEEVVAQPWQSVTTISDTEQKARPSALSVGATASSIREDTLSCLRISSLLGNPSRTELLPSIALCAELSYLSLQSKEGASPSSSSSSTSPSSSSSWSDLAAVCKQATMAVTHAIITREDQTLMYDNSLQDLRFLTGSRSRRSKQLLPSEANLRVAFNLSPDASTLLPGFRSGRELGQVLESLSGQAFVWEQSQYQAAKVTVKIGPASLLEEEAKPWLPIVNPISFDCTALASSSVAENPRYGHILMLEANLGGRKMVQDMDRFCDEGEDCPTSTTCLPESSSLSEGDLITKNIAAVEALDNCVNSDDRSIDSNGLFLAFNEFYTAYVGGGISYNTHRGEGFDDDGIDSSHSSQDDVGNNTFYTDRAHNDETNSCDDDDEEEEDDASFHGSHPLHQSHPLSSKFNGGANPVEAFSNSTWFDEDAIFIAGPASEDMEDTSNQAWLLI